MTRTNKCDYCPDRATHKIRTQEYEPRTNQFIPYTEWLCDKCMSLFAKDFDRAAA